jgi:glycosyltransferase involved in cell wall biosynthesis
MKKKTLFIVTTVPETLDTILKNQPKFLNNTFDVSVVSSPATALKRVAKNEGVSVHPVLMSRGINVFRDFISLFFMIKLFLIHKPDIVHSYTPKAGLIAMLAARLCFVKIKIHTFTGLIFPTQTGFKKSLLIFIDRIICKSATHIVPEGEGVKRDLLSYKITSKQLKLIGNGNIAGIDIEYFNKNNNSINTNLKSELSIPVEHFVFTFVGRLNIDKGIKELVNAFLLQTENNHLLLVGDIDDTAPIQPDIMAIIKNHSRIHMLGFHSDIRPALIASDVLILSSYREGFPNVVLQAGAMSLPVIATDINGCNEIITPDFNGWLVEPRNEDSLAKAMQNAINTSTPSLSLMACNARTRIVERFERNTYLKTLENFYEQLVKS